MKQLLQRMIAGWLVVLLMTACSFSVSTANIAEATLAKDADGKEVTTTFDPDDTFYLLVTLRNAPDDTRVKASWVAVNVPDVEPDMHLQDYELVSGSGRLTFNLSNDNLWPAGAYKVDIYLNDKLDRSLDFRVVNPLGTQSAPPTPAASPDTAQAMPSKPDPQRVEGQRSKPEVRQSDSSAEELARESDSGPVAPGDAYDRYVTVTDDSGLLQMNVPEEWSQVDGSPWELEGKVIGQSLTAAPDIDGLFNRWDTPGAFFGAAEQFDGSVDELLDSLDYRESCTYEGRSPYEDGTYTGQYDLWSDCGNGNTRVLVVAAQPADGSHVALVLVHMVSEADQSAADQVLATFLRKS